MTSQYELLHEAIATMNRLQKTFKEDKKVLQYKEEVIELAGHYSNRAKELDKMSSQLSDLIDKHCIEGKYESSEAIPAWKVAEDFDRIRELLDDISFRASTISRASDLFEEYMKDPE